MQKVPEATVLQLKTHGIITIGGNCAQALEDLYYFEKACKIQVDLMGMRLKPKDCAMTEEQA